MFRIILSPTSTLLPYKFHHRIYFCKFLLPLFSFTWWNKSKYFFFPTVVFLLQCVRSTNENKMLIFIHLIMSKALIIFDYFNDFRNMSRSSRRSSLSSSLSVNFRHRSSHFSVKCSKHIGQEIEIFCGDHDMVYCSTCATDHR